jgi:hypothetical protein
MMRNYLIFEDVLRDASLKPFFDACVVAILDGSARLSKTAAPKGYPSYSCFRIDGKEILKDAVMDYYFYELSVNGFDCEKAKAFAEVMRKICGWKWEVDACLRRWAERVIRDPFFYDENQGSKSWSKNWILKPGEPSWQLSEDYLRFACYIAVCFVKYGASYDKLSAEEIFGFVTRLGSDLPAKLKKYGSGDLPKKLTEYKDSAVSCTANDVFATVKITLREETEEAYKKALDFLCRLLEAEFPRSYSVDFKSPEKNWLPLKGLPKKGVHQLFANAVLHAGLYDRIERYARLAMKEDEWYQNLENEQCAMPGTFAVFALGLLDEKYHFLACDYLKMCDGEHQMLHGQFVLAYIEKFGFAEKAQELYNLCEKNIQQMPKKLIALMAKSI